MSKNQEAILLAVASLPAGTTTSYGRIAEQVGSCAREVGMVLARYGADVPWWRVLRADGTINPRLRAEAEQLLAAEGVTLRRASAG